MKPAAVVSTGSGGVKPTGLMDHMMVLSRGLESSGGTASANFPLKHLLDSADLCIL